MVSRGDEYPIHQTSRPVRDPGTERNLYDRFFFNGYPRAGDDAGRLFFAVAMGVYPGRNIIDGAFSLIVDGVQHNVRGSRLLGNERLDLRVGPVTVEIVEPLVCLRVRVDDPQSQIHAELTCRARGPVFEEPGYQYAPGNLRVFDITRMTQNVTWSGHISVGPRRIEVTDDAWWGCRDRSWGIRPVGKRDPDTAPDATRPSQFYWLWAPLNFDDQCVLLDVNEWADGSRWHENAQIASALPTSPVIRSGRHHYELEWRSGTRHADGADLHLRFDDGQSPEVLDIRLDSLLTFFMMGVGYTHPTWGHGMWVGPDERTYDSIDLATASEQDPLHQHVQIVCRATRSDGFLGMGVLEMAISGPHEPSGFRAALDFRA